MDEQKFSQEQVDKYFQAPIHEQNRFRLVIYKKRLTLTSKRAISPLDRLLAKIGLGNASLKQVVKLAAHLKVANFDFYKKLLQYNHNQPFYKRISAQHINEIRLILFERVLKAEPDREKREQFLACSTFEELLACSSMRHSYPVVKQLLEQNIRQDIVTEPGELKAFLRIETLDENGHTGLMRAALQGDKTQVQMFLDLGGLVNRKGGARKTALLLACEQEDPEVVRLLLNAGADSNVWDEEGNTPLHLAILYSSKETAKLLLDVGTAWHLEIKNSKGMNPLDPLLNRIKKGQIKELLDLAFSILWAHSLQSEKPFPQILEANVTDAQVKELFLERYEEMLLLEAIKGHEHAPQFQAVFAGNQDGPALNELLAFSITLKFSHLVIPLLKRGATIEGQSPFQLACTHGNLQIIEKLLSYYPQEVRAKNSLGQTPLHLACRNGHLSLAKLLIQARAEIDAKDNSGKTPLAIACAYGHNDLVQLLLTQPTKPKLDEHDLFGQAPFGRAFFGGHIDCCKALLNAGAHVTLDDFKRYLIPVEALIVGRTAATATKEQRQNIIKIIAMMLNRLIPQNPAKFCQEELHLGSTLKSEILLELGARHHNH